MTSERAVTERDGNGNPPPDAGGLSQVEALKEHELYAPRQLPQISITYQQQPPADKK